MSSKGKVDAKTLTMRIYPEAVLRKKAEPVELVRTANGGVGAADGGLGVSAEVKAVAERMIEMMYAEEGIGLAAPQVGVSWRLFVVDIPETEKRHAEPADGELPSATSGPEVYINPVISEPSGPLEKSEEGCLSLPEIRGDVQRPRDVTISAIGLDGKPFTRRGTGLLARCWQHELDHLDGVLIIDRFTQSSRIRTRSAVRQLERDAE